MNKPSEFYRDTYSDRSGSSSPDSEITELKFPSINHDWWQRKWYFETCFVLNGGDTRIVRASWKFSVERLYLPEDTSGQVMVSIKRVRTRPPTVRVHLPALLWGLHWGNTRHGAVVVWLNAPFRCWSDLTWGNWILRAMVFHVAINLEILKEVTGVTVCCHFCRPSSFHQEVL